MTLECNHIIFVVYRTITRYFTVDAVHAIKYINMLTCTRLRINYIGIVENQEPHVKCQRRRAPNKLREKQRVHVCEGERES